MALYPPIVASSMPAFDINDNVIRIYYTLSAYNAAKRDDIKKVHITVRRQSSNVNVLTTDSLIISKNFGNQDDEDKTLNRYYVEINKSELKELLVDALYKVQLRFSSIPDTLGVTNGINPIQFYTSNINNFSEWSTVCIIKPILIPLFYLLDFHIEGHTPTEDDQNFFYFNLADFVGVYKQSYIETTETEKQIRKESSLTLRYWRIRLLDNEYTSEISTLNIDDYVLADSGKVLNKASNYNLVDNSVVFTCSLPFLLQTGVSYKILFEIETKNGYINSLLYPFTCLPNNIEAIPGELTTYINEEEGYIKLNFSSDAIGQGNLLIRRTDSKSNFLKWEDLKYIVYHNGPSFTYYDFTAESGLFYRYLIQKVDIRGRRGTPTYNSSKNDLTGVMAEWLHAYLLESTGNGDLKGVKQLKLKYDFQISSYKTNISESKTDTIGSKYPFIRRNGNMYYRSFPVTGTITEYMDDANLFTDSDTLFNGYYDKYKNFKGLIDEYVNRYDYTYERKFREKVEEFLYNSKPKLYKSMQEGNIFVKLMLVSLTPKNELGRLVYSFSATAYEIGLAKIETYNNYNFITVGTFSTLVYDLKTVMSQISSFGDNNDITDNVFPGGKDIIGTDSSTAAANSIAKAIKYNESFNNQIVSDFNINWLRLTIESDPYLIIQNSDGIRPYDDIDYLGNGIGYIPYNNIDKLGKDPVQFSDPSKNILYQMEATYDDNTDIYLGWLFKINGQDIVIAPPNNIYEINSDDFNLKKEASIIPAKDTAMLVDYRLINVVYEDFSKVPKSRKIEKVNGQLIGTYSSSQELISQINYKHSYSYNQDGDNTSISVNGVKTILIDTEPRTIVLMKTSVMDLTLRFIVNLTGELNFDPNTTKVDITYLKIKGINVPYDSIVFDENNMVTYRGRKYSATVHIERDGITKTVDIDCPVDALIFYNAAIEEDIY